MIRAARRQLSRNVTRKVRPIARSSLQSGHRGLSTAGSGLVGGEVGVVLGGTEVTERGKWRYRYKNSACSSIQLWLFYYIPSIAATMYVLPTQYYRLLEYNPQLTLPMKKVLTRLSLDKCNADSTITESAKERPLFLWNFVTHYTPTLLIAISCYSNMSRLE